MKKQVSSSTHDICYFGLQTLFSALKLQKKTEKKLLRKERREELRKKRAEEEEELEVENLTPGPQARFQHYGDDENGKMVRTSRQRFCSHQLPNL